MKNRDRGKALEKAVAKDLGGRRIGLLGMEDVTFGRFSIETKEREKLPVFLKKCITQAESNAGGKVPVVILHELGDRHSKDLVVMRYFEWKKILDKPNGLC
jgi:hypothetical protein